MLVEQMLVGPMAVFCYIVGCENGEWGQALTCDNIMIEKCF